MKSDTYKKAGETAKLYFPRVSPAFPPPRIARVKAGETGETSLEFPPFPRPRCAAAPEGAK